MYVKTFFQLILEFEISNNSITLVNTIICAKQRAKRTTMDILYREQRFSARVNFKSYVSSLFRIIFVLQIRN